MNAYVVTENVKLISGGKGLKKDAVFSEKEVSPENLERWLKRGYVRKLDKPFKEKEISKESEAIPDYISADYYLTPDEVNKLKQKDLFIYGSHIGVPDIKANATATSLRKLINEYIDSVDDNGDDDNDEGGDDVD